MQLSGLKFTEDVKSTLEFSDNKPSAQKRLVETVMSLPEQHYKRSSRVATLLSTHSLPVANLRKAARTEGESQQ